MLWSVLDVVSPYDSMLQQREGADSVAVRKGQ